MNVKTVEPIRPFSLWLVKFFILKKIKFIFLNVTSISFVLTLLMQKTSKQLIQSGPSVYGRSNFEKKYRIYLFQKSTRKLSKSYIFMLLFVKKTCMP